MGSLRKNLNILIIGVLICIVILVFINGFNDTELEKVEFVPGVEFENIELIGNHKGETQWRLISQQLHQKEELVYLTKIEQVVLFSAGEPKYYVYADKGIWDRNQGWLQLTDNVTVVDEAGFRLNTSNLTWHAESEILEFVGDATIVF